MSVVSNPNQIIDTGRARAERPLALFVYGTLAPNEVNGHVLGALSGSWTEARVKGELCDAGWGAAEGFPGLRLSRDGDSENQVPGNDVAGLLFESDELGELWETLDAFEGAEYRCETAEAILQDGRVRPCVVYAVDVIEA